TIPPEVRSELQSLLANASTDLENSDTRPTTTEPEVVDRYRLIEELLPRGGMGLVYRARRDDEHFHKEVALKLLRRELVGSDWIERFRLERQILANLEHPSIARLLDGGATSDGRPYLVMEFVDGLPITAYSDRHELGVAARLELFLAVCAAVEAAHRQLVVHRDLKPSNILITEDGRPKLLDFGIAKVLHPANPAGNWDETAVGRRVMTPEYASPEQLRGETIGVASDVFSLGVVLCELLTGERPFADPRDRESPARAPSFLIGAAGGDPPRTGLPPHRLARQLAGDLDAIVLKAVEQRVVRRYPTVAHLATDLRRSLRRETVRARVPTLTYRTARLLARHRVLVPAVVMVVVALCSSLGLAIAQAHRAKGTATDLGRLAHVLLLELEPAMEGLPSSIQSRKTALETAVDALDRLANDGSDHPELLDELARSYEHITKVQGHPLHRNLGDTEGAIESCRKAIALRRRLVELAPDNERFPVLLASSLDLLSGALERSGELQEATTVAAEALGWSNSPGFAAAPGGPTVRSLCHYRYGDLMRRAGRRAEAHEHFGIALAQARSPWPIDADRHHVEVLSLTGLARLTSEAGSWAEARRLAEQAVALGRPLQGSTTAPLDHQVAFVDALLLLGDYTNPYFRFAGQTDRATSRRVYEEALLIAEQIATREPADLWARAERTKIETRLAMLELSSRPDEGRRALRASVGTYRELLANSRKNTGLARQAGLALAALCEAEFPEDPGSALETCRELVQLRNDLATEDGTSLQKRRDLATSLEQLATVAEKLGRSEETSEALEKAYRLRREILTAAADPGSLAEAVIAGCRRLGTLSGDSPLDTQRSSTLRAEVRGLLARLTAHGESAADGLSRTRRACELAL
ncbi:MAG: serine/threonine-protein kinase, partial [Thermoanaerobaculia bacterium]|nr:serine/threonine-protein kinase [Thermoanaerobaculia bacterium]